MVGVVGLEVVELVVVGVVELEVVCFSKRLQVVDPISGSNPGMNRGDRNTASLKTSPSGVADLWSPLREPVILLPRLGGAKQTG